MALAAGIGALGARRRRTRFVWACVALGAASGFGHAASFEQVAAGPQVPFDATIEATIRGASVRSDQVHFELGAVRAVEPLDAPAPERLLLTIRVSPERGTPPAIGAFAPGDRVRARVRIRPLETRANPGTPDRARRAARRGIAARAALVHEDLIVRRPDLEGWRPLAPLHRLRARAARRMARHGPGGGLARALALGDRGGLERSTRDAFQRLGISHLLAVSGLHLALVAALAFRLLVFVLLRAGPPALRADPRAGALFGAVAAAGGYALLAGFGIPVRRALVVLIGLVASIASRHPTRRGAPLVAAAVVLLAFEPAACFEIAAQLSFAASAALVWATRPPLRWIGGSSSGDGSPAGGSIERSTGLPARVGRALAELLGTTALASAATAPIAAGTLGLAAPGTALLANALAIPWTALLLLPVSIVTSWVAGLAPESAVATGLCAAASGLGTLTLQVSSAAAAHVPALPAAPRGIGVLAAAIGLALVSIRTPSLGVRLVTSFGVVALLAIAPPPRIAPAPPRVVVLDVGQGDAVLVQGRRGALLVDAGIAVPEGPDLGQTIVVPALRALGVTRLDLVVASHADLDHRGGLPAVLRSVPVDRLWLPYGGTGDPAFAELVAAARAADVRVEEQGAGGAPLQAGNLQVTPLWPPSERPRTSGNDASLLLRVGVAGRTILLPGDLEAGAEAELLAAGARLRADVLKLAHHGSRTSSSAAWLAAVDGAVAIASAPRFGRFGMPHAEVVERVQAAGYTLWWTGRDGAVLIGLEPVLHVRGWRRGRAAPGPHAGAR